MKRFQTAILAALVLCLAGCNATRKTPSVMPPITPPQAYTEPEERYDNPGSLYMSSESDALFADTRARRIGDIVMVKVVEKQKAKNKADATASKENKNTYSVDANFGKQSAFGMPTGGMGLSTGSKSELTSDGETNRESVVTATVAARVTRVMPGGLLQIEGARETRVNNETQYLVITGLIRPMDVAADNSITSNRISDAQIAYYGEGVLSDKEKPGWFTRLMDNAWPF
ncbi:MAG: flagellar basal body L-ring protein FlgH [Bilophila sp.]